jgi:hypothetical protein
MRMIQKRSATTAGMPSGSTLTKVIVRVIKTCHE